jgi:hypothetical protein
MFTISLPEDEIDIRDIVHTIARQDVEGYVIRQIWTEHKGYITVREYNDLVEYKIKCVIQELKLRGYDITL